MMNENRTAILQIGQSGEACLARARVVSSDCCPKILQRSIEQLIPLEVT